MVARIQHPQLPEGSQREVMLVYVAAANEAMVLAPDVVHVSITPQHLSLVLVNQCSFDQFKGSKHQEERWRGGVLTSGLEERRKELSCLSGGFRVFKGVTGAAGSSAGAPVSA